MCLNLVHYRWRRIILPSVQPPIEYWKPTMATTHRSYGGTLSLSLSTYYTKLWPWMHVTGGIMMNLHQFWAQSAYVSLLWCGYIILNSCLTEIYLTCFMIFYLSVTSLSLFCMLYLCYINFILFLKCLYANSYFLILHVICLFSSSQFFRNMSPIIISFACLSRHACKKNPMHIWLAALSLVYG